MSQIAERYSNVNDLARTARDGANGHGRPWLDDLRQRALARFTDVGFPNARDEEWRFTNLAPIAKTTFKPGLADAAVSPERVARFGFRAEAAVELVFVNGHYAAALSHLNELPRGLKVLSLAAAVETDANRVQAHLGRYASIQQNPFVALNTGSLGDGAYVHMARGTVLERPIHLLFVSTAQAGVPTVTHPRVLIVAEDGARATIVESYVGAGDDAGGGAGAAYFTNAVTEVVAGPDAVIDHYRLQQEGLGAYHVSTLHVNLDRSADFISHAATLGGALTRNDLNVWLNGEYAHATLNGLVIIGGTQHVDNHTLLRHEKANCPSHELYKHVLDGRASGVFKGKIFVQKDAQKTDSKQGSKSLLLSDDATMNSQPALEIYADDVKCTHGSTIGPVDDDMVFYLRTRGVGLDAARHLLTYAFAADVTRRIRVEPVRRRLEDFMAAQHGLPQDLRITDVGAHDEKAR